jgi:aminoglycoside phosphotransferase (APT) family kinase protein
VLAFDADASLLAMEYLDGSAHRLWKSELLDGTIDVAFAGAVGDTIGAIHEHTAGRADLADRFDTDHLFFALRIEPYFLRLIAAHPELAECIDLVIRSTMDNKRVLVHGDVSPKNILMGPHGPVILDAETAWWGDPAFDVAFCLNHLLLKSLDSHRSTPELLAACEALVAAYTSHVVWEPPAAVTERVATLLPLLLLARVDGRSPVEYLDSEDQELVRAFAIPRILNAPTGLAELLADWKAIAA